MKTLFVNATIYAPEKLRANSIAVADGKILEIGSKAKLIDLKRHGFSVIDLKKRTILPGFIDAHLHLLGLGFSLQEIDLQNISSFNKVITILTIAARKLPHGRWLFGRGWNKNLWGGNFPDKVILDKICPDNPVHLYSKDGHSLWVNSAALKIAGIDRNTPDPPGGQIKKFSDGTPSGMLFENACYLVDKKLPSPTTEMQLDALRRATKKLNSFGITAVGDADWRRERFGLFKLATDKGLLSLRVFMMLSPDDIDSAALLGLKAGFGDRFVNLGALKLYADGALGSQSAWMHAPYEGNRDNRGIATLTEEQLEMYYEKTHIKGIPLAIHAIGDRANSFLLDFFGKKQAISHKLGLKHRIEHVQVLRKEDIGKFKKYDIAASVQPIHLIADRDMADRHWGERSQYAYAFNSLLKSGAKVGFGSDAPIESASPFMGIYAAVARKAPEDTRSAWYPEQCLKLNQAVAAYTSGAADICGWSDKQGRIAEGMAADFVVLSDDIYKAKTESIPEIKALATIVDGQIVYQDNSLKL
jgi:predicted amidohydrolase YtcJ